MCFLRKEKERGWIWGGRKDLGEDGGCEIRIGLYCMGKYPFSILKKENKESWGECVTETMWVLKAVSFLTMGNTVTWRMCANSGGHAARENTRIRWEQFPLELRGRREMTLAERLSDWKALGGAGAAGGYIQRCPRAGGSLQTGKVGFMPLQPNADIQSLYTHGSSSMLVRQLRT